MLGGSPNLKVGIGIFLILLAVLLETIGDICFKSQRISVGYPIYILGSLAWAFSLKQASLSKSIVLFTLLNSIFCILAGFFWFSEPLSISQKFGIVLVLISITLLLWSSK